MTKQLTADDVTKIATMRIRKIARRGTNSKLEELVRQVFASGVEYGMQQLSSQLKERLNANEITNNGNNSNGVGGQSDSPLASGSRGVDADDLSSDTGSSGAV